MTYSAQAGSGPQCGFNPTQNFSSATIRHEVKQFATKANQLADQILNENSASTYEGPVIIRNHYHYSPWCNPWFFNPYPSVVVVGDHPRRRQRDDDSGRILIGILATVGALIASYAIGTAIATHNDARQEVEEATDAHEKFKRFGMSPTEQELVGAALEASHLKMRICSRIKGSATADLALRVSLAVGLGAVAGGAFAAAAPVLAIGVASSVVIAASMLIKWGYESSSKSSLRDAQVLKDRLNHLQQL